jgi:hypothetical protein
LASGSSTANLPSPISAALARKASFIGLFAVPIPGAGGQYFLQPKATKSKGLLRAKVAKMSCQCRKGRRNDRSKFEEFFSTRVGDDAARECGKNAFDLTRRCGQLLQLYIPTNFVHCIDLIYAPLSFSFESPESRKKELPCCYAQDWARLPLLRFSQLRSLQ